jgi:hypothetical protein
MPLSVLVVQMADMALTGVVSAGESCAAPAAEEPDQAANEKPYDYQRQNDQHHQNEERAVRHQEVRLKRRWHGVSIHGPRSVHVKRTHLPQSGFAQPMSGRVVQSPERPR